jgi:hypothetical protein
MVARSSQALHALLMNTTARKEFSKKSKKTSQQVDYDFFLQIYGRECERHENAMIFSWPRGAVRI